MEGHGKALASGLLGELDNSLTSADVLNLCDDLLVCIFVGEGSGLELVLFVFGV